MNTKHTQGEWKTTGLDIRHKNTSLILATVYPHLHANQSREEAEANAKLIAAAPELLEALIKCHSIFSELDSWGDYDKDALEQAAKVIAKATE